MPALTAETQNIFHNNKQWELFSRSARAHIHKRMGANRIFSWFILSVKLLVLHFVSVLTHPSVDRLLLWPRVMKRVLTCRLYSADVSGGATWCALFSGTRGGTRDDVSQWVLLDRLACRERGLNLGVSGSWPFTHTITHVGAVSLPHTLSLTLGAVSLTHLLKWGISLTHTVTQVAGWVVSLSLQSLKWGLSLSHSHSSGGCLSLSNTNLFHTHTHSRTLRVSFLFFSLSRYTHTLTYTPKRSLSLPLIHSLDLSHTYTLIHTHSR